MKKIPLTILIALIGVSAFAQSTDVQTENVSKKKKTIVRPAHCPAIYVTTGTGINSNTGILGFSFDVPVSKNVSIDAGPGTGTWGYKVYAGAKYYLRPCHRGFAFGAGLTYCPGVYHDQASMETIFGNNEVVTYNKNSRTNMLFAVYKYWSLGKKYNRFYLEFGWSVPLDHTDKITQVDGDPMTSKSLHDLGSTAPGGPIIAAGFSFGMH